MKIYKAGAALAAVVLLIGFWGRQDSKHQSEQIAEIVNRDPCDQPGNASDTRCLRRGESAQSAAEASQPVPENAGTNDPAAGDKQPEALTNSDDAPPTQTRLLDITTDLIGSLDLAPSAAVAVNQPLKVAFIGDQGATPAARAVLRMIKAQGADMVLHQGDFDYEDNPKMWDALISEILGADFPYFASIGNHDIKAWHGREGYQSKLKARLSRIPAARCGGDLGVMSACRYKGLFFVLSGIGTLPNKVPDDPRHVEYISGQLAKTDATWRICSWHKNQRKMQPGGMNDSTGWAPYEACRKAGAIIATGHSHAYARTHLMENFRKQDVTSHSSTLVIKEGMSFAFVSGLGGHSIGRKQTAGEWWASTYTKDNDADHGALFCTFNTGGDPTRAECYFRDIRGRIADTFKIRNSIGKDQLLGSVLKN